MSSPSRLFLHQVTHGSSLRLDRLAQDGHAECPELQSFGQHACGTQAGCGGRLFEAEKTWNFQGVCVCACMYIYVNMTLYRIYTHIYIYVYVYDCICMTYVYTL